jgi:hypothetical protein
MGENAQRTCSSSVIGWHRIRARKQNSKMTKAPRVKNTIIDLEALIGSSAKRPAVMMEIFLLEETAK